MLSFIPPGAHGCSSRGHSLAWERICAGKWKRKESLGCLRRARSPSINKSPGSSSSSGVGNSCTSVPAGGHAPVSIRCALTAGSQSSVLRQHSPERHPLYCAAKTPLQPDLPARAQQDPALHRPAQLLPWRSPALPQPVPSPVLSSRSAGAGTVPLAKSVGDLPCL